MELVVAGKDSEQLPHLKVTEADHTPEEEHSVTPTLTAEAPPGVWGGHSQGLLRLMAVRVEAVGRQLLYVCFGEAPGLGISQPLSQVQEGLEPGKGGQQHLQLEVSQTPPPSTGTTDLIVLHLHVIHIQIQADGGAHGGR